MHKTRSVIFGLSMFGALIPASCGPAGFESTFAPTGARGATDEFGRLIYLDEECGGLDDPAYPEFYQNALFRDGSVAGETLWLVDGAHLWSASIPADRTTDSEPVVEVSHIGHGNAVAATDDYIAVALVEGGLVVYPDYDFSAPVKLSDAERIIDLDASGDRLAVAAGEAGLLIYDMYVPERPALIETIETGGFASGARWGENDILYFSACSVVGYVNFQAAPLSPRISGTLAHRNAKDAHGNGERLAIANNGGGVWFFDMETLIQNSIYELNDPNFYANAAFVEPEHDTAYVAAGNREIVALSMEGHYRPEPRAVLPKDPLGITVHDDVVYGFGNFRNIGERTVVRAPALDGTPESAEAFAKGLLNWIEPAPHAFNFTDTTGNEWLTRFENGGYAVYVAAPNDTKWTKTNKKFYFIAGTYAVDVTADNAVRFSPLGSTVSTVLGEWPDPFPPGAKIVWDGDKLVVTDGENEYTHFRLWKYSPYDPYDPYDITSRELNDADCRLEYADDGDAFGPVIISGVMEAEYGGAYWCSRLVDPYTPSNRPELDHGTYVFACIDGACLDISIRDSGLTDVIVLPERRGIGLFDDRIAYTTSIVEFEPFSRIERSRRVFWGRPNSWRLQDDGSVRVLMMDGSAFTYHPDTQQVSDRIEPLTTVKNHAD